jgi:hypothetical protein
MSSQLNVFNMFVKFAAKEMNLSKLPKINFVGSKQNSKGAFGHSKGNEIWIRVTDRHPVDIMRTIAHELIHIKQTHLGKRGEQFREDEANALAGRIMRKFSTTYPGAFTLKSTPSNLKETESLLPANIMGGSSATQGTGGIDTYNPLMGVGMRHKKLKDIIGRTSLKDIRKQEHKREMRNGR